MKNELKSLSLGMKHVILNNSKYDVVKINYYDMNNIQLYSLTSTENGKIKISEENECFDMFSIFPFMYNNEIYYLISLNGSSSDAFIYQCYNKHYKDVLYILHGMIGVLKSYRKGNVLVDGEKLISDYLALDEIIRCIKEDKTRKILDMTNMINEEKKLKEER